MSVLPLLARLKESGIKVRLEDGELKITASKGKLTPDLINRLKEKKEEIIAFLRQSSQKRVKYEDITLVEKKEYYPLSSAQKRLFLVNQIKGNDISDNTARAFMVEGHLDRHHVVKTIRQLILRQEILRTSFETVDHQPVQRVHQSVPFDIMDIEVENNTGPLTSVRFQRIIDDFIRPFDLSQAPILRVGLLKLSEQEHLLICDMHHIVNDAASIELFYVEFITLYAGRKLRPLKMQYKDFATWQHNRLYSGVLNQQEQYWLRGFSGQVPRLNMPTDYPRPPVQSFHGNLVNFMIDKKRVIDIYEIISPIGATLHMALFCVYNILLYKYTGQEDIVVGTSSAGRPHADLQNVIGFFVNTLPIRSYPRGEKTFRQFLEEVKNNILKAVENQDYQFDDLVNRLGIPRDPGRQPLFDTHFTLHSVYSDDRGVGAGGGTGRGAAANFSPYFVEEKITQFDTIVHAIEDNSGVLFSLRYCTKLFKKQTMERLVGYYQEIIRIVLENKDIKLKDIKISHNLEAARTDMPQAEFIF